MTMGSGRREIAALKIAEHFRLPPVHAEQIGSARHIDIEEGTAHQEVRGFRGHVLGKLGQSLRGDDAGKTTLTATAHQIGHRAKRSLACIFRDFTGNRRRKHLRFIHHHKHRIPEFAIGIEQAVEESSGRPHLLFDIETFQRQHAGNTMLANAVGDARELGFRALAIHDHMAEFIGQRNKITLGIDDDLLHPWRRLLEQPAQQMRLAGTGIALHQQTRRKQFFNIELGLLPAR